MEWRKAEDQKKEQYFKTHLGISGTSFIKCSVLEMQTEFMVKDKERKIINKSKKKNSKGSGKNKAKKEREMDVHHY